MAYTLVKLNSSVPVTLYVTLSVDTGRSVDVGVLDMGVEVGVDMVVDDGRIDDGDVDVDDEDGEDGVGGVDGVDAEVEELDLSSVINMI